MLILTRPAAEIRRHLSELCGVPHLSLPLLYTRRVARLAPTELSFAQSAQHHILVSRASALAAVHFVSLQSGIAIGAATGAVLREMGIDVVVAGRENSESALDLPALKSVRGKSIAIWCAPGGRSVLLDTLRERGADARAISAYRRVPRAPSAKVLETLRRYRGRFAVTATSVAILERWHDLCAELPRWRQQTVIAASQRIAGRARQLGFAQVDVAEGASVRALVMAWRQVDL